MDSLGSLNAFVQVAEARIFTVARARAAARIGAPRFTKQRAA